MPMPRRQIRIVSVARFLSRLPRYNRPSGGVGSRCNLRSPSACKADETEESNLELRQNLSL